MVICLQRGADWSSWCHCHSLSLASVKSRLVLPFWYRPTRVVLDKGPLNGCVFGSCFTCIINAAATDKLRCMWNNQQQKHCLITCLCDLTQWLKARTSAAQLRLWHWFASRQRVAASWTSAQTGAVIGFLTTDIYVSSIATPVCDCHKLHYFHNYRANTFVPRCW